MIFLYNKAAKKNGKLYLGTQKTFYYPEECYDALLKDMKDGETVYIIEKLQESSIIHDVWDEKQQAEVRGKFG